MTYPIETKLNQYPQGFSATPAIPVDKEKVKQSVNQSAIIKQAQGEENPALLLGVMAPVWLGISHLMQKFNYRCSDANGKSILHKIAEKANAVGEHKFFKLPKVKQAGNIFSKTINVINTKIIEKSAILKAIFKTPTRPELSMAKMMSKGTIAETAIDASQAIEEFISQHKTVDAGLKALGIDKVLFENIKKSPYDFRKQIVDICKRQKSDDFVHLKKFMGGKLPKFFQRKVYWSELANKLSFLEGLKNPNPNLNVLGKSAPKWTLRTLEGLTNGTAGGKFAILMQAYIFASAFIKAVKAPKGEKIKTFSENIFYDLGMYLTIPASMSIMHGGFGTKYIGMSKKQVEFYRKTLGKLNASVDAGTISKAKYLKTVKDLKVLLKGDTKILKSDKFLTKTAKHLKNIVYGPLKWMGRMGSIGLERIKPYIGEGSSAIAKGFGKIKYKLKGAAGWPVRFLLFSMVFAPFLGKYFAKASHVLFGKPTKSVLDTDEKSKNPAQVNNQPIDGSATPPASLITPSAQNENLLNMYNKQTNQAPIPAASQAVNVPAGQPGIGQIQHPQQVIPQQNSQWQMPAQHAVPPVHSDTSLMYPPKTASQTPPAPARTYIPSANPVVQKKSKEQTEAEQKIALALQKADAAERYVKKYSG